MSGANEKANLKGSVSSYLIGVALIVLCSTIAAGVAGVASKNDDNTASGIVDLGFQLGGINVGEKEKEEIEKGKEKDKTSKLAISGTDGAYVEILYNGKTYKTTETLPGEISQEVIGGITEGTEITLKAWETSENGIPFDCWAIVDDEGNIVEVLTRDYAYTYEMGSEDVNIQAIYKEKDTQVPEDTDIEIGQVTGRAPAKINVQTESPIAVVAANPEGVEGTYSVSFRNYDKKDSGGNDSKDENIGDSYTVNDNGVTGSVYTVDNNASSGRYTITVETNTGNPPQNLSITQYDKNGNATDIAVPIYNYDNGNYYDANGKQVSTDTLSKLDAFAVSYDSNRDIDIETTLDLNNYSYVVNADCIGGE